MDEFFPAAVYILCFITSSACAFLLGRSYRSSGARLLLWSAACFVFLAANNLFLVLDLLVFPDANLRIARLLTALAAVAVLIVGFIWDAETE
ncbi:DUF5985 family protein [Novosphingobium tardum]|uniref:DUF5985 family protein n=1 Tax=Novosphingobium tardum TaxID=1538021 RepID=A0ABV8RTG9_9SPHN